MGDGIIACPSAACRAAGRSPSPRGDIQCCARHAQLPRPHGHSYAGTALARSRSSFSEPSKMDTNTQAQGFLVGIRQILIHGAITLLAIVIAFSLPPAARYILYVWWPRVETDTSLLLVTEIGLASALVLLFNLGKKVTLKFYDEEPFWKVVVLGDHVWVQHCHHGCELNQQPEYVFALQHHDPRRGLFVPFYTYFLERWNESRHPEYDFDSSQLVYRDAAGHETGRAPLGVPISSIGTPARHGLTTIDGHNQARLRGHQ